MQIRAFNGRARLSRKDHVTHTDKRTIWLAECNRILPDGITHRARERALTVLKPSDASAHELDMSFI